MYGNLEAHAHLGEGASERHSAVQCTKSEKLPDSSIFVRTLSKDAPFKTRWQIPDVIRAGHNVLHKSLIELGLFIPTGIGGCLPTRTIRHMWFTQIPTLYNYRGAIRNDKFTHQPTRIAMEEHYDDFEREHRHELGQLVQLIRKIRTMAQKSENDKVVLVKHGENIGVYGDTGIGLMLSEEVKRRFWGGGMIV